MRIGLIKVFAVALVAGAVGLIASAAEKKNAGIGSAAPGFTLKDQDGKAVSLSDYKDKIVVLEWFNEGCPYVARHIKAGTMNSLATSYKDKGVVWLAIKTNEGGTCDANKKVVAEAKLAYTLLNDDQGGVARSYAPKSTPHMFIIDKSGKLAYTGAIDDDPDGDKAKPVNYVAKALNELLAGGSVSTPETKAYGCGVKYPEK
jgi:peroxiredoxin